jgi:hypothetical protein
MKKAINRLLQFVVLPLWLALALAQLLTMGLYAATYWLRFLLMSEDTSEKFAHPKTFLNRIFEATDKFIYMQNGEVKHD